MAASPATPTTCSSCMAHSRTPVQVHVAADAGGCCFAGVCGAPVQQQGSGVQLFQQLSAAAAKAGQQHGTVLPILDRFYNHLF